MEGILESSPWDMIVVDEAHHLTRKDYGTKADKSDRYIVAERLKDRTNGLLFLTATPHQGDRNKFYNLVRLLAEDLFRDDDDLFNNRGRLENVMIRQRKIDVTDEEGKPLFVKRVVNALTYSMSEEERSFFIYLNRYLIAGYKTAEQDISLRHRALAFVMTTFQKLAASSIFAVKMALQERLVRLLFMEIQKTTDGLANSRLKEEIIGYTKHKHSTTAKDEEIMAAEAQEFEAYLKREKVDPSFFVSGPEEIELLKDLLVRAPKETETKMVKLLENVRTIKRENPAEKVIVFTEYLNTQDYIVSNLQEAYGYADVVMIRGGDHSEKMLAAKRFKETAHFLVSTQAGGEGINLQHCHIIINYDMPWNPMKVEQRIGRIHRYKQKDTAQVYNMFAKETIEERIYQKLEAKLSEIAETIGNEDEREAYRENILGILAEELNFDELYKDILRRGLDADAITKEKIDAAIERAKEVYKKLGDFTQDLEKFSLDKYFKTKGDVALRDVEKFVLDFVRSEGKKVSQDDRGFYEFIIPDIVETYGGHKYTRITFDRDKAVEDPSLQFMALGHRVTDAILRKCTGYGFGGRCAKRQISNIEIRGQAGTQCNLTVAYQVLQPGAEKSKILRRDFLVLVFDEKGQYRPEWEKLGLLESDKAVNEEDFEFVSNTYLEKVEQAANAKVRQIIEQNLSELRVRNPNVVCKHNLENIAFFVFK
jgi:SNF2 family DNA or RNA helicase